MLESKNLQKIVAVFVSGHGLGHINQMRPLLKVLYQNAKVLLITNVSKDYLKGTGISFDNIFSFEDVGLISEQPIMVNSIDIDLIETKRNLSEINHSLDNCLSCLKEFYKDYNVSSIVSNIESLPLVAAQELSINNYAFCSLDWFSVYEAIGLKDKPQLAVDSYLSMSKNAYQKANIFFRPIPYTPIAWLKNEVILPPQFIGGKNIRNQIDSQFNTQNKKLIMVNFGGVEYRLDKLPLKKNIVWVIGSSMDDRDDVLALDNLQKHFVFEDVASSIDLLVTKPGYGTFVLAASNGVPVVSIERNFWPDVESLEIWIQAFSDFYKVTELSLVDVLNEIEKYATYRKANKANFKDTEAIQIAAKKILNGEVYQ
jgi:hypothetical protein